MTSVLGHLMGLEFEPQYKNWRSCPPGQLFEAPVLDTIDDVSARVQSPMTMVDVPQDKKSIAENIKQQARFSRILFIWTDCDREGEHIGTEVRKQAFRGNQRLEVKRARFNNTERAWVSLIIIHGGILTHCSHVIHAAQHPIDLDDRQANAVAARIELDLRIGAAFTRLQTLQLQNLGEALQDRILSYGRVTRLNSGRCVSACELSCSRIMPISHIGLCGRSVLARSKF